MGDIDPSQIGFPLPVERSAYRKQTGIAYKHTPPGPLLLDAYRPGRRRSPPAGGDDPRRRLGARRALRDGADQVGRLSRRGGTGRGVDRLPPGAGHDLSRFVPGLPRCDRLGVDHAAELGADAARIGLWGDSAGGHLVLLARAPRRRTRRSPARACAAAASACAPWWRCIRPTDLLALRRGRASRPQSARAPCATSSASIPTRPGALARSLADRARARAGCRRSSCCRARATSSSRIRRRPASPSASPPPARRTASRSSTAACTASTASAPDERALHPDRRRQRVPAPRAERVSCLDGGRRSVGVGSAGRARGPRQSSARASCRTVRPPPSRRPITPDALSSARQHFAGEQAQRCPAAARSCRKKMKSVDPEPTPRVRCAR